MSIFWHIWIGACATSFEELDPEAPDKLSSGRSTSIPAEDLSMVLKHYGLDCQDENEKNLPAGTYFCSARPWDIIYYRRLKKGSVSTEKYARRVDQNREFGIVTNILEAEVVGENYNKITR